MYIPAILTLFTAYAVKGALSACVTDGGYADADTPCASDCFSFPLTLDIPYIGSGTLPTEPVKANASSFCTTVPFDEYDPFTAPDRKFWGFCYCTSSDNGNNTNSTEYKEVWLADGGGVGLSHPESVDSNGYQDCVLPFTYVDEAGNELEVDGCADINELPPFLGSGSDFPYPPLNTETLSSLWCPINSAVYEISPSEENIKQRKDWGYCLLSLRQVDNSNNDTNNNNNSTDTNITKSSSPTPLHDDYYWDNNETEYNETYSPTPYPTESGASENVKLAASVLFGALFITYYTVLIA